MRKVKQILGTLLSGVKRNGKLDLLAILILLGRIKTKNIREKTLYKIVKTCCIPLLTLCVLSSAWSCGGDEKNNPHSPVKSNIQLSKKKEASLRSFKQPLLTQAEIKQIGQMHNKVLSNILDRLQHKKFSHSHAVALEELSGLVNDELDSFYRKNLDSEEEVSLAGKLSHGTFKPYSKNDKSDLSPIQTIVEKDSIHFSKAQIKLLSACDEVLNSACEVGLTSSKNKLNEIQEKAQTKLPADQAQVILIAAEVGKASLSYWHENINAWKKALKNVNIQQNANGDGWFRWCELGKCDVIGAIEGFGCSCIMAAIPGVQPVWATSIAVGAGVGSAASALGQIWDHYCRCDDTKEKEDHGQEKTHP